MTRQRVDLAFAGQGDWVLLDEVTGAAELSVSSVNTEAAIGLLDSVLIENADSAAGPGEAATLSTADRDRLLAAVYMLTYGDRVETTLSCGSCESLFDVDFSLDELVRSLKTGTASSFDDDDRPLFQMAEGTLFRLPTGDDEMAVMGLDMETGVQQLLQRCVIDFGDMHEADDVQAQMSSVAPTVDLDLTAFCPECGAQQQWRFDLQRYLLTLLRRERSRVTAEVHTLARSYGWSFTEIMGMPRSLRREFVGIVNGTARGRSA